MGDPIVRRRPLGGALAAIVVLALALSAASGVQAQEQSVSQQRCIGLLNKSGAAVGHRTATQFSKCLKRVSGSPPGLDAITPCVQRSALVITRAFAKTEGLDAKACEDPVPDFGYSSAATVNAGFRNEMRGLVFDLFGLDLDGAVVLQSEDEPVADCQLAVDKFLAKFAQRKVKEFLTCKRLGLRDLTITSSADLEGCLDTIAGTPSSAPGARTSSSTSPRPASLCRMRRWNVLSDPRQSSQSALPAGRTASTTSPTRRRPVAASAGSLLTASSW